MQELECVGERGTDGRRQLWFLNWTSGWDTWTRVLGQTHPAESTGVAPHPPIATAAPKHAGYLGSLRTDLWLKRRMQSQGGREQAGSWKTEHDKHIYWSNYRLQFKITRVVTMSVEELLVRAVVWVSRYALHPPLRDAVAWRAHWKTAHEQKIHCYFGTCVSASLFPFLRHTHTNTHTLWQRNIAQSPPAHTHTVLYKHATVSVVQYFITDGPLGGQGVCVKSEAQCNTDKLQGHRLPMQAEESGDAKSRPCPSRVFSLCLIYH